MDTKTHDTDHGHGHHIVSVRELQKTFGFLTLMMLLTIGAARLPFEGAQFFPGLKPMIDQFAGLWWLTNFIALGIATWKAVAVILTFMGVKFASSLVKIYVVCGFVGFTLLFILFFDYAARGYEPVRGWEKVPSTAFPRDMKNDGGIPYKEFPGSEHGAEPGATSEAPKSGH